MAENKAEEILTEMSIPIKLNDREALIKNASTSLNSKVVAQSAGTLAPIAVDAVFCFFAFPSVSGDWSLCQLLRIASPSGFTWFRVRLPRRSPPAPHRL